jgi:hypothetical protein
MLKRAGRRCRCYDEMDCYGRSKGGLGSSKTWAKTQSEGGIMSANCKTNPVRACGGRHSPAVPITRSVRSADMDSHPPARCRTTATSIAST